MKKMFHNIHLLLRIYTKKQSLVVLYLFNLFIIWINIFSLLSTQFFIKQNKIFIYILRKNRFCYLRKKNMLATHNIYDDHKEMFFDEYLIKTGA